MMDWAMDMITANGKASQGKKKVHEHLPIQDHRYIPWVQKNAKSKMKLLG